ncbi:MAG: nodulation protein NfeD [bacterium]
MRTRITLLAFLWLLISLIVLTAYATGSDSLNIDSSIAAINSNENSEKPETTKETLVLTLSIDGTIGTVTELLIEQAIKDAVDSSAELLVIYLNTPGGFTNATWDICMNILNADVPVCMYIAPRGAKAGSAGVYMTYASHIAAMAPSTNIGAAHPVSGDGKEIDSVMNEKITNDAVAQIKAAAENRGRNVEWAEKAVRESVSIPDKEALELNVVDYRAEDIDDLLSQLDQKDIKLPKGSKILQLHNYRVVDLEISFIYIILGIITDPNVAFILFSLGSLGLVLELYNPGSILPGVVGAICIILALFAFQTLPINYAGLALIILAIILFIAEIKVISHGLLTIGGVISLFFGGLMLIDSVDPTMQISKSVLIMVVLFVGVIAALAAYIVIKAQKRKPFTGEEGMVGKIAEVRTMDMVYVNGALWKAEFTDEVKKGDKVEVIGMDKLTLKVKKI